MIFFRQKLEEVITLPPPPKDDMSEALEVNEITLIRTPEQVQQSLDAAIAQGRFDKKGPIRKFIED